MPFIVVRMLEGRDAEQRRKFARAVADAAQQHLRASATDVQVHFVDVPRTHFFRGGTFQSDLAD
ncbi:tautomerase family protein [Saccharopolyspora sp. HNM0986]|uniref:tautomerase family protein n=1 Tax=Saccharopolyspora galaxeae TaxID=2781241 RepID=UPI001909B575|nr:tautomerase family protein [Saccharopolyspora sp. HNM0986]MBK0868356.1 tautomerase family protein [Saccharopolyspora sp. HNM0986]